MLFRSVGSTNGIFDLLKIIRKKFLDILNLSLIKNHELKVEKLQNNNFLYLVVLGGRAEKANIELHDVRWVVGSKIEETYDTLRRDWFGSSRGLHIDSYKKIQYIDGHKINLINVERNKTGKKQLVKKIIPKNNLWFEIGRAHV